MERILLRAILGVTLKSRVGREIIVEKHGRESLQTAQELLHQMGNKKSPTGKGEAFSVIDMASPTRRLWFYQKINLLITLEI